MPQDPNRAFRTVQAQDYRTALAERSSYVENVLIHRLVALIAGELWLRDPSSQLQIFNSEVDDSGLDLVLVWEGKTRFIQVKQVHLAGKKSSFSVRLDFSRLIGSCVVAIVHSETSLEIDHFLYFGGSALEAMPAIDAGKLSILPGRRDSDGKRRRRPHYRDVPRNKFRRLSNAAELFDTLFIEPRL